MHLSKSDVENAAMEWFRDLGYAIGHGPHLALGETAVERMNLNRTNPYA